MSNARAQNSLSLTTAPSGTASYALPLTLSKTSTGPLTQLVKRSILVHNPHSSPVAFKVKTTAPKQYCVRPNSGRIEPGESVDVSGVSCSEFLGEGLTRSLAATAGTRAAPTRQMQGQVPGAVGVHFAR